jgi:hypothetical protein
MSKKFSILEIFYFTYVLHTLVDKNTQKKHFLDRRFSGWRTLNWASVVLYPTNSTESSVIYKLTIRLVDYLNFKGSCPKKLAFSIYFSLRTSYIRWWRKTQKNSSETTFCASQYTSNIISKVRTVQTGSKRWALINGKVEDILH